jgi:putative MATE family efflux protein
VHAPQEIRGMASAYLTIMMATMVFQFFLNWMTGMLRGLGDSKTVLKILGLLTAMNVLLVPLFIHGVGPLPALGVAGAAYGTALATFLTGGVGYVYLMRHNPYVNIRSWDFALDWPIIRQVFIIGVPASLTMIVTSLAGVLIISLVNTYGTDVTAGFGIGMQIDMMAILPSISIGMAVTSVAGQNLGARKLDRVAATLRVSLLFSLAIAVAGSAVLALFPREIGTLFLRESAERAVVLERVAAYYRWCAFVFPCYAAMFAVQGVLRAAGDTIALLVLAIVSLIAVRIPLAHLLAGRMGLAQNGIWMAILFSSLFGVAISWAYYSVGRWKKLQVLSKRGVPEGAGTAS